jgi:hypothetical protein
MLVKSGDFMPPETARPGLNPELYRVIRKAMAKAPADRYQKAEEMLVDVEQVMRLAFRAVGQTELQRWLADLSTKDGVPTLTREAPPEPPASRSTVGPLRAGDGQESGLVLNLDEVEEVKRPGRPPPHPGATVPMMHPPQFVPRDRPWSKRPEVRIGGAVALVLVLGLSLKALAPHGRSAAPAAAPPATVASAPSPASPPAAAAPPAPPAAAPTPPAPPAAPAPTPPAAAVVPPAPAPTAARPAPAPDKPDGDVPPAKAAPVLARGDDTPGVAPDEERSPPPKEEGRAKEKRPQFAVLIKSDPEGSRVSTGHHVFGSTPLTLKLRPGNSYELTFTKAGYTPVSRHFRFEDEEAQTLRVTLKKAPEPHKAASPPPAAPKPAPSPPPKKSWFGR